MQIKFTKKNNLDTKDENGLIINGIFDLVFIKDNKVYVLDYKTDRVSKDNSDETLKDLHRTQLSYYSKST